MTSAVDRARQRFKHGPSIPAMRKSLPDLGESINTICSELERDLTIERAHRALEIVAAAKTNLAHLCQALELEKHGTG